MYAFPFDFHGIIFQLVRALPCQPESSEDLNRSKKSGLGSDSDIEKYSTGMISFKLRVLDRICYYPISIQLSDCT